MSKIKKYLDGRLPLLIKYEPIGLREDHIYDNEGQKDTILLIKRLFSSVETLDRKKLHKFYDSVDDKKIIADEEISQAFYLMGGG